MKPTDMITFNGKKYPLYEIEHPTEPEYGTITIGTEELCENLCRANMFYMRTDIEDMVSETDRERELRLEAERIDEQIYCYMSEDDLSRTEDVVKYRFKRYFD